MCSILAGLAALSTVTSAYGSYQQAAAQSAALEAQAKAAERNAHMEEIRQDQIANKYAQQGEELKARRNIAEGQVRAQAGSAGLGMAGSPMDLISSGYEAYNQDKMNLLVNQRNDNWESRVAQTNFLNEAASARSAAKNVKSQAVLSGIGTILGGAASIYGMSGGGSSRSASSSGSSLNISPTSTRLSGNTKATWTPGAGYSFSPYNTYGGRLNPGSYFGYR